MKIAVLGMGYVGLPLTLELSKKFQVVGFDKDFSKIKKLKKRINYIDDKKLKQRNNLQFSNKIDLLKNCNIYIICVPTPVFKNNKPDVRLLTSAFKILRNIIKKNDLVISESTVYPGLTQLLSKKILERKNFITDKDFFLGYSPERINPGDRINKLKNICKIISSHTPKALKKMKKIYSSVADKIYITKKIQVAEASKVIENAQRDINIAFINEVSKVMIRNKIPVFEVLKAANTKWNFLDFKPGLVGGHCIGVDPYYLNFYAKKSKIRSKVIISGREVNDRMPHYFSNIFLKELFKKKKNFYKILMLGVTFKENINDFRNSKALEICKYLKKNKKITIDIFDPMIDLKNFRKFNQFKTYNTFPKKKYDAFFLGAKHLRFKSISEKDFKMHSFKNSILFDIFNFFKLKDSKFINYITI